MTRAELQDILAKLSPATRARVSAATLAAVNDVMINAQARKSWAPYDSKWELDYAQRLHILMVVGEIVEASHHPPALVALGGTKYTPDFYVRSSDGRAEYHEVKGYLRSRDAVRMRECAAVSALPILVMSKRNGVWTEVRRYEPGARND